MDDTVWADDVWGAGVWADGVWAERGAVSAHVFSPRYHRRRNIARVLLLALLPALERLLT